MRILVRIARRGDQGWTVVIAEPGAEPLAQHEMDEVAERPHVNPAGGGPPPERVRAAAERLVDCGCEEGDVRELGRHLFLSLIGADAWSKIARRQAEAKDDLLELALEWPRGEARLEALNWEAMHDGERFLAAIPPPMSVTVTRVVADASDLDGDGPRTIEAPANVLFVIGSDLGDARVRAGAEIMGLLRKIELERGAINSSVLQSANIESLKRRVRRFRPDIVHFIAHGELGTDGSGVLELRRVGGKRTDVEHVSGAALLDALRTDSGLPLLVVLTACDSASVLDPAQRTLKAAHVAPLAAELVHGGIPAVVGMTGRVTDRACRLFTRQFGAVLTFGEPLVAALMRGRSAGLLNADDRPANSLDWALPALYLAPGVDPHYAPIDRTAASIVLDRVDRYGLIGAPVFCGRRRFMDLFEDLIAPGGVEVLAIWTKGRRQGIGKTRLVHEMMRHALRNGHVPVLLRAVATELDPVKTPERMAVEMLKAIIRTRENFDLPFPSDSELLHKLEVAGDPEDAMDFEAMRPDIRGSRLAEFVACERGALDPEGTLEALAADLTRLIDEARAADDPSVGEASRAVVFVESIDRWDYSPGAAGDTLLKAFRSTRVLGTAQEPVPLVCTCALEDIARNPLEDERQEAGGQPWHHWELLAEFDEGGEDRIAYEWVLLNPRFDLGEWAEKVYVPREPGGPWIDNYRHHIGGFPAKLSKEMFYAIATTLTNEQTFLADDEREAWNRYESHLQ